MYRISSLISLLILTLWGCSTGTDDSIGPSDPLSPVNVEFVDEDRERLYSEIESASGMSTEQLLERYAVEFSEELGYEPAEAINLQIIQESTLALDSAELGRLADRGFVISDKQTFPTFVAGYEAIYAQDLPVYVSADAILFAVHRSYDAILKTIEEQALVPELEALLLGMRARLADGAGAGFGPSVSSDLDLFLAVALGLLTDSNVEPIAGSSSQEISEFVQGAKQAEGLNRTTLFGVARDFDFSQFTPRGHYTDSLILERYFRAMMWLGRIDFRMLEAQPDGTLLFHRRQLEAVYGLGALLDAKSLARWERIHTTIGAFVGEPDYMELPALPSLLTDLGLNEPSELPDRSDQTIATAILTGGYGTQRISSHIMIHGIVGGTLPLSSSFAFFGQRYVVDSHVFSNLVFDRVVGGSELRMLPDPLDVAFAALGNDQAATLLRDGLDTYHYAPDLHAMRFLVDQHPAEYWTGNLYNLWLGSLRTLSGAKDASAQPGVFGTEAWGRRLLNSQLASWAELRHDTILYVKQSYTSGNACEFPDAYVDPYPAFFQSIEAFAAHGREIVVALGLPSEELEMHIESYFHTLEAAAGTLREMAELQLSGEPFSAAHMEFINQIVAFEWVCGVPIAEGWYGELFFDRADAGEFDPTIADVHTQPTDEGGGFVGRVLHVGTGSPRLLVVTAETCSGPRAYVGLASSYFETVTEDFQRLTDEEWSAALLEAGHPPDVPWLQDLIVR